MASNTTASATAGLSAAATSTTININNSLDDSLNNGIDIKVPIASPGEETTDEVKVFRSIAPEDDPNDLAGSSADNELNAEKQELALEADIESQADFTQQHFNPIFNPSTPIHWPSLGSNFIFNHLLALSSPVYLAAQQKFAAAMVQTAVMQQFARHSPNFMNNGSQFAAAFERPPTFTMGGQPCTPSNNNTGTSRNGFQFQQNMGSPMTSLGGVLGGISLSGDRGGNSSASLKQSLEQQRQQHSNGRFTNTPLKVPKREKTEHRIKEKNHHSGKSIINSDGKHEHIKKPMNAFMLFMKENRHKYMDDCADKRKQSAELNKELGQIWQKMSRDEQQPYYEMAQQKREEHQRLYPNWTARENYAIHKKAKKRRTRERSLENNEQKKCRARFGIDNVIKWCKHCKRKKRCLNVRDSDSPAQVSSTTNPTTPLSLGGAHLHNQQGQSSSNGHQNSQFGHSLGGLFNLNQTQQHQQQQKQPLDSPMSSQKGQSTNSELSRCSSSASSESLESDVSEDKDDSQQTMEGLETSPMQKHNGGNIKTYKMETSDPIPSPHTPPSHLRRKHQHHNHQQQQSPLSVDTPKHLLSLNNAGMDNLLAAAAASSLLPHHSSPFSSPSTNSILQQNVPSAFQMPPGTPTGFPFQNPFMPFGMNFMPFMKP